MAKSDHLSHSSPCALHTGRVFFHLTIFQNEGDLQATDSFAMQFLVASISLNVALNVRSDLVLILLLDEVADFSPILLKQGSQTLAVSGRFRFYFYDEPFPHRTP